MGVPDTPVSATAQSYEIRKKVVGTEKLKI
jgi:hypothetical protein